MTDSDLREHTAEEKLAAAKGWRKVIWRGSYRNEDERLTKLTEICTKLEDGDVLAGAALATKAIWTP